MAGELFLLLVTFSIRTKPWRLLKKEAVKKEAVKKEAVKKEAVKKEAVKKMQVHRRQRTQIQALKQMMLNKSQLRKLFRHLHLHHLWAWFRRRLRRLPTLWQAS